MAEAKLTGSGEIEIWGDGSQTRTFMYINDCVIGTLALMDSDFSEPVNLRSSELVTIGELVSIRRGYRRRRARAPVRPRRAPGRQRAQQRQHLVVRPRDHRGFVAAAERLLGDADLRQELGANARRYAETHFGIGAIGDRFEMVLKQALDDRPRPSDSGRLLCHHREA